MKKFTLSIAAIAAMGTFAVAGGDIAPVVEEPVAPVVDVSGFYAGIGYSAMSSDFDNLVVDGTAIDGVSLDTDESAGLFIVGYQYNEYLSFEARWTHYVTDLSATDGTDTISADLGGDNIGLYIKPQYSMNNFTVYGLIGYGWTDYSLDINFDGSESWSDNDGDFQWGLGVAYAVSEHTSIFVDYTDLHNGGSFSDTAFDTEVGFDNDLTTWNFGLTYKF